MDPMLIRVNLCAMDATSQGITRMNVDDKLAPNRSK